MNDLQRLADAILDQETGLAEGRYIKAGDNLIPTAALDPPQREWAIRHRGGKITVRIDGRAFFSRAEALQARATLDQDCEWCDGGPHALAYRDKQPWRDAP